MVTWWPLVLFHYNRDAGERALVTREKQEAEEGGQVPRAQSVTDADHDQEKDCSQTDTRASEQDRLASVRPGLKGQREEIEEWSIPQPQKSQNSQTAPVVSSPMSILRWRMMMI